MQLEWAESEMAELAIDADTRERRWKSCSRSARRRSWESTGRAGRDSSSLTASFSRAHVVKGKQGDPVQVRPWRSNRAGTIRDVRPDLDVDLALVDVEGDDGDERVSRGRPHPQLDHGVAYVAAGYLKAEFGGKSGLEVVAYDGHRRLDAVSKTDVLLVLEAGGALIGAA